MVLGLSIGGNSVGANRLYCTWRVSTRRRTDFLRPNRRGIYQPPQFMAETRFVGLPHGSSFGGTEGAHRNRAPRESL